MKNGRPFVTGALTMQTKWTYWCVRGDQRGVFAASSLTQIPTQLTPNGPK